MFHHRTAAILQRRPPLCVVAPQHAGGDGHNPPERLAPDGGVQGAPQEPGARGATAKEATPPPSPFGAIRTIELRSPRPIQTAGRSQAGAVRTSEPRRPSNNSDVRTAPALEQFGRPSRVIPRCFDCATMCSSSRHRIERCHRASLSTLDLLGNETLFGLIGHRVVCLNLFGRTPCSSSVCSAARPDKLRLTHASFFVV